MSLKALKVIFYLLLIPAIFVSVYLLFQHYSIASGKSPETDLCYAIFGKGCAAAALTSYSVFLKIPVGGWGLIYLALIGTYFLLNDFLDGDECVQIAFWISFGGIAVSLFYLSFMIIYPMFFCPFCTVFHFLNFGLFIALKRVSGKSFKELAKGLFKALGIVFLAKPVSAKFPQWKWLLIVFPVIIALSFYQWSLIQGLNTTINKLANYNPLLEVEDFELQKVWDVKVSPEDPLLGPENAPVNLVVFSDFQCTMCGMFASNLIPLIQYNKGRLNIRFKYFPLSSDCNPLVTENLHPFACEAARAAQAAHLQGRFWEYHDSIYVSGVIKSEDELFQLARILNLDMEKFASDYHSDNCQEKINSDILEGNRLKLEGTPTVFLNGRIVKRMSRDNINFLVKFIAN
jgi:protein-disulfide isomerase